MNRILKIIFFAVIVKPVVLILLGLNIVNRKNLPEIGPAIIAANHNSHLDTLVLMSLFPLSKIHKIRPVAAADYFLTNAVLKWFSLNIIGIIPIQRHQFKNIDELFKDCYSALDNNEILIIFPEGSRGKPEQMGHLKKGLYYLVKNREKVPVIPVVIYGLGHALPRGEALFVPYNCDVVIGDVIKDLQSSKSFVQNLTDEYEQLLKLCLTRTNYDYDSNQGDI